MSPETWCKMAGIHAVRSGHCWGAHRGVTVGVPEIAVVSHLRDSLGREGIEIAAVMSGEATLSGVWGSIKKAAKSTARGVSRGARSVRRAAKRGTRSVRSATSRVRRAVKRTARAMRATVRNVARQARRGTAWTVRNLRSAARNKWVQRGALALSVAVPAVGGPALAALAAARYADTAIAAGERIARGHNLVDVAKQAGTAVALQQLPPSARETFQQGARAYRMAETMSRAKSLDGALFRAAQEEARRQAGARGWR